MLSRREMVWLPAAAGAAAQVAAASGVVVASANGLRACERAMQLLQTGADTLDAVIAGVNINEEDPEDNSVGYGGLPNEDGIVELDASVMHGPTRRAGAVAALRGVKTPSKVARLVMEKTDHIMLVGEGALRFARAHGFAEENLLTEKSRLAWLVWKQGLRDASGHNNWNDGLDAPPARQSEPPLSRLRRAFPGADPATLAWAWEVAVRPPAGTISCLALDRRGEMSGVTTTSGLAWKIPGRVGDSPIIGAGLYVDQEAGAAGSTGRGEENIRVAGAHTIVENMRRGMTPREACLDALRRIARNFDHDSRRLEQFDIAFYALRNDGQYAGASLWSHARGAQRSSPRQFAVNTGSGSRLETCSFLFERR
jgi:N4-(beta-N-acetylglucosaminyl)-L-asparaginase